MGAKVGVGWVLGSPLHVIPNSAIALEGPRERTDRNPPQLGVPPTLRVVRDDIGGVLFERIGGINARGVPPTLRVVRDDIGGIPNPKNFVRRFEPWLQYSAIVQRPLFLYTMQNHLAREGAKTVSVTVRAWSLWATSLALAIGNSNVNTTEIAYSCQVY